LADIKKLAKISRHQFRKNNFNCSQFNLKNCGDVNEVSFFQISIEKILTNFN